MHFCIDSREFIPQYGHMENGKRLMVKLDPETAKSFRKLLIDRSMTIQEGLSAAIAAYIKRWGKKAK